MRRERAAAYALGSAIYLASVSLVFVIVANIAIRL